MLACVSAFVCSFVRSFVRPSVRSSVRSFAVKEETPACRARKNQNQKALLLTLARLSPEPVASNWLESCKDAAKRQRAKLARPLIIIWRTDWIQAGPLARAEPRERGTWKSSGHQNRGLNQQQRAHNRVSDEVPQRPRRKATSNNCRRALRRKRKNSAAVERTSAKLARSIGGSELAN